jgi:hypothetical protein
LKKKETGRAKRQRKGKDKTHRHKELVIRTTVAETQSLAADECELMRAKCVDGMEGLSARTQQRHLKSSAQMMNKEKKTYL